MYKLGHRPHQKQKLYALLILLFAGLVMAGVWAANKFLQSDTTLGVTKGVVRHVDVATPPTKVVSNSIFTMKVPRNWQTTKSSLIPAAQYAWRGTGVEDSPRNIEVYVDAIPAKMAVNKLLPLRASGNRVMVGDSISDNCVSFTDSSKADKQTGTILAKWSDVNFYCDTGNYARNVVGTGSPDAINSITLDGQAAGVHRFFFLYTDNSSEPDYSILTNMLDSFRIH